MQINHYMKPSEYINLNRYISSLTLSYLFPISVEWYAMCAVVLGSVACVVAAAVAAYKCYNRKLPARGSHQQLSTAIKQTGRKGRTLNTSK